MKIEIIGEITDQKCEGCFSPIDLKEQLESVDVSEPLEVTITSEGGSVFAGMQIANMLSRHQGNVTTHAVGLCASIATVILMAGDRIVVDDSCFCLIHLPWSCIQGNANDMAKEIDALKKCEAVMMGYYKKHLKTDETALVKYMEDETWFLGNEFADIFDVEVVPADKVFNIAAKCDLSKFKKLPKVFAMETEEVKEDKKLECEVIEEDGKKLEESKDDTAEVKEEEKPAEDIQEDKEATQEDLAKKVEELERENEELKKQLEAPVEERVRGMQSKMAKQLNSQKAEYCAKIEEFENQLKAKVEELTKAKAEVTSLNDKLEKSAMELSKTTSALVEKTNALAMLNAGVNKPSLAKQPMTKAQARQKLATMPLAQRAEFYRLNKDLIDG